MIEWFAFLTMFVIGLGNLHLLWLFRKSMDAIERELTESIVTLSMRVSRLEIEARASREGARATCPSRQSDVPGQEPTRR